MQEGNGYYHQGERCEGEKGGNDNKGTSPFPDKGNIAAQTAFGECSDAGSAGDPATYAIGDYAACIGQGPEQCQPEQGTFEFLSPYHKQVHRDHSCKRLRSEEQQDHEPVGEAFDYTAEKAIEVNQVFPHQENNQHDQDVNQQNHQQAFAHVTEETPLLKPVK